MAMCSFRSGPDHSKQRNSVQNKSNHLENRHKTSNYSNTRAAPQQLEVRGRQIKLTPRHIKSLEQAKPTVKRLVKSPSANTSRPMIFSTSAPDCVTSPTLYKDPFQNYVDGSYSMSLGRRHVQLLTGIVGDPDGRFININAEQQDVEMDSDTFSVRGIEDGIVEKMEGITLDQHIKPVVTITPAASDFQESPAEKRQRAEEHILCGKNSELLSVPVVDEQEDYPKQSDLCSD